MWRYVRIAILLFVLASVAQTAWLTRSRSAEWKTPLRVAIYPVAADDSDAVRGFIPGLRKEALQPIEDFFSRESAKYGVRLAPPVELTRAPLITSMPPSPPYGGNTLQVMVWSLKLRFWAWRNDAQPGVKPHVRIFVLYHDPAGTRRLPHSTGLQKGMLGLVHAFASADMQGSNAAIIAHELLHTLGATDKYDPATNQPVFPDGYAEPDAQPRHPQRAAEIMAGRIAISETQADIPRSLNRAVIGEKTAREIGWLK